MSHRVSLYSVRVRPRGQPYDWKPLGDIDDAGAWFGDLATKALQDLDESSPDGKLHATVEGPLPNLGPDDIGFSIMSGQSGVRSLIADEHGAERFRRRFEDSEQIRSAIVYRLPPRAEVGHLLVHSPHGRGRKTIVAEALRAAASAAGFTVETKPIVSQAALRAAIEANGIMDFTLVKYDPLSSDGFNDAAKWGSEDVGRLELRTIGRRHHRLRGQPVLEWLDDSTDANRRRLIEFEGLEFDEADVRVKLLDGRERTFHLDRPEGGHPVSVDIDINERTDEDDSGATATALSREMRGYLESVLPRS